MRAKSVKHSSLSKVENGLPEEAIAMVHRTPQYKQLLTCAAAFLARVAAK